MRKLMLMLVVAGLIIFPVFSAQGANTVEANANASKAYAAGGDASGANVAESNAGGGYTAGINAAGDNAAGTTAEETLPSPYQGLEIRGNTLYLAVEGLPQASWSMEGELKKVLLVDRTVQGTMEEAQVAAHYVQPGGGTAKLTLHLRKLPGGDMMVFTRAEVSGNVAVSGPDKLLTITTERTGNVYGSKARHFVSLGAFREFLREEPFLPIQRLYIKAGTQVDQWHIFGLEDLTITNPISQKAWDASLEYHGSNDWVTPEGTYRRTPGEYFSQPRNNCYNVNLQASTPLLLLDSLKVQPCRLLEDFVHSAKFTLVKTRGNDGFWRTGVDVAYLNHAYNLGPNFIDTRMSVDASFFLVKYGLMFNNWDAVTKGAEFKNFFLKMKAANAVYTLGGGVFYPDYYSESQRTKTLVSLNHAIYEMNYLYTLYNFLGDYEAKALADEMLLFVNNSKDNWVAPDGDLYYALSPAGQYYAKDYVNITYVDLYVAKGILEYMEVTDAAVKALLTKKEDYLYAVDAHQFESRLKPEEVFQKFDFQSSRKGNFFFPYPLSVKMAEEGEDNVGAAYFSLGTYHFVKGAESVTYLGKTYDLDPKQKYFVVVTKWGLAINAYGDNTAPVDTGGERQNEEVGKNEDHEENEEFVQNGQNEEN